MSITARSFHMTIHSTSLTLYHLPFQKRIAFLGQTAIQAPHCLQFCPIRAFCSVMTILFWGHTETHFPQPIHSVMDTLGSVLLCKTFFCSCSVLPCLSSCKPAWHEHTACLHLLFLFLFGPDPHISIMNRLPLLTYVICYIINHY